ncbi:MAG: hypothetical protein ACLSHP_06845 [Coprococcus sp.]
MKLDLDRIGTELGQKAKIEENPPMQRRKKQAGLGKKLKNRIFAPTGRRKKQAGLGKEIENRIFAPTGRKKRKQVGVKKQKKKNCSNRKK